MLNTSSGKNHELKKYSNSLYISKHIKNFSDSNELPVIIQFTRKCACRP